MYIVIFTRGYKSTSACICLFVCTTNMMLSTMFISHIYSCVTLCPVFISCMLTCVCIWGHWRRIGGFGQGWVIVSHIILWDVVAYPCVGRRFLAPGSLCAMCMVVQHIIISPVSEWSGDVMVLRRSRPPPAARHPPPTARNGVNAITKKPRDGLFSNLVHTLVVIKSWPYKLFKVVGKRSRSQRQKMMWFFRHFLIFISYHIFLLNQVEGAIAIPPSNSAPLPLFCPSVCPSVCPSIGLLTTFSGFCTFADKSLGRNGIELEMQMFPDDLPLANIDADGYCCHFMRSSVRPTIHGLGFVYCIQSAWKKWPTIWHADVSRWLTLSIHGCLWILLLVCLSVHLSVCSFVRLRHFQVAVHLLTNHLEQMA